MAQLAAVAAYFFQAAVALGLVLAVSRVLPAAEFTVYSFFIAISQFAVDKEYLTSVLWLVITEIRAGSGLGERCFDVISRDNALTFPKSFGKCQKFSGIVGERWRT